MSSFHEIRLAGPWECSRDDSPDSPQRCTLPFSLSDDSEQAGSVALSRRFHQPTGLDANSQVWIVVKFSGDPPTLAVNGIPLNARESSDPSPETEHAAFNATNVLKDFNTLTIEIHGHQINNVLLRIVE